MDQQVTKSRLSAKPSRPQGENSTIKSAGLAAYCKMLTVGLPSKMKSHSGKIYLSLIVFSILLVVSYVSIDKLVFSNQLKQVSLAVAENKSLERESVFQEFFLNASNQIQAVKNNRLFTEYLSGHGDIEQARSLFMAISRSDSSIMQIRFIDKKGIEKIRIDRKAFSAIPETVPDGQLQDKSSRYYFTSKSNLDFEHIWFSDLDLNIERGKLEVPYKATIRAIAPLTLGNGFEGIVIINYFMSEFLRNYIKTGLFDLMLIDDQLNTLVHHDKSKSWSQYSDEPYLVEADFEGLRQAIKQEKYLGKDYYIRRLDLATSNNIFVIFKVKKSYIIGQKDIADERLLIVIIASFLFSSIISIIVVPIINILSSDIKQKEEINALLTAQREDLARKSITDDLTKLYNRRYYNKQSQLVLNSMRRDNKILNFLMLDVDHFKQYNDNYGHLQGDKALEKISGVLREEFKRSNDHCFRMGGEEFAAIFSTDKKRLGNEIAESIRESVENLKIECSNNGVRGYLTVSVGLLVLPSHDVMDIEDAYKQADELLYKAKNSGRNIVITNVT